MPAPVFAMVAGGRLSPSIGGTSLALIGAYVLAGELGRSSSLAEAMTQYEGFMRPIVDKAQGFPKFILSLGNPQTLAGVRFKSTVLSLAAVPALRRTFAKLVGSKADKMKLPAYGMTGSPSEIG